MKTVLVTGGNGFTGRYVIDALKERNYQVVSLVHGRQAQGEYCDLADKKNLEDIFSRYRPDAIIHLAALSFVAHDDPSVFYSVNVIGTTNLLEAVEKSEIKPSKIIIASSANIYGNPKADVVSETEFPCPVNHYAASKLAMEYMVRTWFDRLPIIITRPFNYTGIGQDDKFLIPKIVSHFKQGKKEIELGNLDIARDFSDVRDVAMIYRELLESDLNSEIVNISKGEVVSLDQVIKIMEDIAGYKIDVRVNPDFVRKNEIKVLMGDNSKLVKLTGYSPRFSFRDTLQAMYSS